MRRISYQLYSARNFGPIETTLQMLAQTGYREVEGYAALMDDPAHLKAALDDAGLRMTSCHVDLARLETHPAKAIAMLRDLGVEKVFVPYLAAEERPLHSGDWRDFAGRLERAGRPLQDAGMIFGWHNHDFECTPTPEGDLPLDLIADGSDTMRLQLDLGWVLRAGLDPVERIGRYGSRITAVHAKDVAHQGAAIDEDGWADIGHGIVDWSRIQAALIGAGIDHIIAEHDNPSDARRFATRSFATLRSF